MGVDPESFARALRFRVAVAELDQELLDTLASRGRLTAEELVAEFDGRTERQERLLASGEVDVWATHRKTIRGEILAWLESRRRLGLVVGESGSMTAFGASVSHPEWRLTEEGIARLRALSEEQRLIPRALLGRLGQTAVDGLTMAITTATAAVPALLLAWMVGLINDPSPVAFLVAGVFFAAVSIVAAARLRAVRRARTPAQREVERVGQESPRLWSFRQKT